MSTLSESYMTAKRREHWMALLEDTLAADDQDSSEAFDIYDDIKRTEYRHQFWQVYKED